MRIKKYKNPNSPVKNNWENYYFVDSKTSVSQYMNTLSSDKDKNSEFNRLVESGKIANLPEVKIIGYPYVKLRTYPIGGPHYKIGHSEISTPNVRISSTPYDKEYNLLFNNCSHATSNFLRLIYGEKYFPKSVITTPNEVELYAKKVPNSIIRKGTGPFGPYTEISIPTKNYFYNYKRTIYGR